MDENRKTRVIQYCNQFGLGGTERTMEIFCRYLDSKKFEVYAIARPNKQDLFSQLKIRVGAAIGLSKSRAKKRNLSSLMARQNNFERILGRERVLVAGNDDELREMISRLKPDVLHVHYSGRAEIPTNDEAILSKIPVTVTTNQFELENTASAHRLVRKIFLVSNWLKDNKALWAKSDPRVEVFYNPTEKPFTTESLRSELGIPAGAFVLGRVGRPDNGIYDPISLKAYARIQTPNTWFLALSPPQKMLEDAARMGLTNFVPLPPNADEMFLSKFYNTIDVLTHARRDGETFGCNLAEAMIHGKPVVSHKTPYMNAQIEVIADGGYVCEQDDWETYARHLAALRDDTELRARLGSRARQIAEERYEAQMLTSRLEDTYEHLLAEVHALGQKKGPETFVPSPL